MSKGHLLYLNSILKSSIISFHASLTFKLFYRVFRSVNNFIMIIFPFSCAKFVLQRNDDKLFVGRPNESVMVLDFQSRNRDAVSDHDVENKLIL